jgi:hypothetical protein
MIRNMSENGPSQAAIVSTTKPLPARTMHLIFFLAPAQIQAGHSFNLRAVKLFSRPRTCLSVLQAGLADKYK